jgi:hypothetical protein
MATDTNGIIKKVIATLNVDVDGAMVKQGEIYGNLVESFVYGELIKHNSSANKRGRFCT